jgi:HlyD family secretion protein
MVQSLIDGVLSLLVAVIPALGPAQPPVYAGYLEGEFRYIAPAAPGRIVELAVVEGERVDAGALLFRLEDASQRAGLHAAEAQVAVAQATLDNLRTGSRDEEIAVLRASLTQAEADRKLAQTNLEASRSLVKSGALASTRLTSDQAHFEAATARVAQLQAQLKVADLPARSAQQAAAEAALHAAEAEREAAQIALADRQVLAPVAGRVEATWYDMGEVASPGTPVVSLLPQTPRTAIFFYPELQRARLKLGAVFQVDCDGCPDGLEAEVTRIDSQPQFTPPIIYSREERQRLVYRVEGKLRGTESAQLSVGQPISLEPLNPDQEP